MPHDAVLPTTGQQAGVQAGHALELHDRAYRVRHAAWRQPPPAALLHLKSGLDEVERVEQRGRDEAGAGARDEGRLRLFALVRRRGILPAVSVAQLWREPRELDRSAAVPTSADVAALQHTMAATATTDSATSSATTDFATSPDTAPLRGPSPLLESCERVYL